VEGAVGLCTACAHARVVVSGRGSTFWLCGLSATDARFPKYPQLPVTRCSGFRPCDEGDARSSAAGTPPAAPERDA